MVHIIVISGSNFLKMAMQTILTSIGSLTCLANLPLIASVNPCPDGFHTDPENEGIYSMPTVKNYLQVRRCPARCNFGRTNQNPSFFFPLP
jgi:hypothetical protein